MASDGQVVVAAARWSDREVYLKDLNSFPAVVKIIKGQYGGLGVPSLPNPGLQSTALLVTVGRRKKILAQAVKLKEGRGPTGVGPRLAIPETYQGYFEILSEEGRAGRCIESVAELARLRPEAACLVREPLRSLPPREGEAPRTLLPGEVLYLGVEVRLPGRRTACLRCHDSLGEPVLLGLDQRGKFSPLAKEDNISGVHTARTLLEKRMPLTVRLVHGAFPGGLKPSSKAAPEMRLLAAYKEEHLFALPLQKKAGRVVALPAAAPLKVKTPANAERLEALPEYRRLVERAERLAGEAAHLSAVLEGGLGSGLPPRHRDENRLPGLRADDYNEIDRIYDYVRGFAPLPEDLRSPFADPPEDRSKPDPPPVETIPGKKKSWAKGEKRTRKGGEPAAASVYVKNGPGRGRLLWGKREERERERSPGRQRYKSLGELHRGDTLDSSHSGGRTSADSGTKLPEKRSRRLPRPLSLTDLVWELRPAPAPPHRAPRIGTLYL